MLWLRPVYNERDYPVNMAAATAETSVSRNPSEKAVKEALDMLKPPGILSKVDFVSLLVFKIIPPYEL